MFFTKKELVERQINRPGLEECLSGYCAYVKWRSLMKGNENGRKHNKQEPNPLPKRRRASKKSTGKIQDSI